MENILKGMKRKSGPQNESVTKVIVVKHNGKEVGSIPTTRRFFTQPVSNISIDNSKEIN